MTTVRSTLEWGAKVDERELYWKQKYSLLLARLEDIRLDVENHQIEREENRVWELSELIYVGFNSDIISVSEKKAKEIFGEGRYDIYRLWKSAEDMGYKDLRNG